MGNQQSTSNAIMDVVNTATTNVLMQNSNICGQNNSQSQTISISNIKSPNCPVKISGISQTALQAPNFTCLSDSSQSANIATQLQSAIKQQADAAVGGLSLQLNSQAVSNATTKIQNAVNTNVNISNLSSCIQNNLQDQNTTIHTIESGCPSYCAIGCAGISDSKLCETMLSKCSTDISNISQAATQAAVANCTSKNSALTSAVTSIANDLSQSASSSATGINIPGLASLGALALPCIIIVIILIILAVGFMFIK